MPENVNETKKSGTNSDIATDSWIEKYYPNNILIKFEIRISQLIAKILFKQRA